MSTEDQPTTELRVGGWVPPPPQAPAGHPPLPDSFLAAAATATEVPPPGASAGVRASRQRRTVVICAALGVLLVTSAVAWESTRQSQAGTPRFVMLPSVPALPALPLAPGSSAPAPASIPASGSASSSPSASASRSPSASPTSAPPSKAPSATPSTTAPKPAAPPARATTAAPAPSGPFTAGTPVSLELANYPGYRLRHQNYRARVDRVASRSSALDRADSRFTVRAGLADAACVSFESFNYPGYYLRHRNGEVWLDPRDSTDLYRADATFCPVAAGAAGTVTLRSKNYPDRSLSVRRSRVDLGSRATTFTVRPPL
ncbi:AbfB domain-containing protein [Actinoplanes sp. TFC3]|uniref:AbfB domain-containing protein n=1 Tax=Actinoplanes sp. TFC3 TaxID=1710355 RepID=UPI000A4CD39A|nr:AbfB domain-containing protein [Actinoplanes sp. TFC3]